jgi:hypothetical protein
VYLLHLFVELGQHEPAVLLGHGALVLLHGAPTKRALELLNEAELTTTGTCMNSSSYIVLPALELLQQ